MPFELGNSCTGTYYRGSKGDGMGKTGCLRHSTHVTSAKDFHLPVPFWSGRAKRDAQSGFLGLCASRCLHTYHVPASDGLGKVSPLEFEIPFTNRACQQSQNPSALMPRRTLFSEQSPKHTMTTTNNTTPGNLPLVINLDPPPVNASNPLAWECWHCHAIGLGGKY